MSYKMKAFLLHYHPQSFCPPGNILSVKVCMKHKVKNEKFFSQLFCIFNRSTDPPVQGQLATRMHLQSNFKQLSILTREDCGLLSALLV